MKLRHHDLIVVPFPDHRPGIYWMRLYAGGENDVAVLTEVPGNTSSSVSSGITLIREWISREHGIPSDRLVLFEISPAGRDAQDQATITRIEPSNDPRPATRAEIESLIGCQLPALPSHEDLYARVLRLGGGTVRTIYRIRFCSRASRPQTFRLHTTCSDVRTTSSSSEGGRPRRNWGGPGESSGWRTG